MKSICVFLLALACASAQPSPNELNEQGLAATDRRAYDEAEELFLASIQGWQAKGQAYDLHAAIVKTNLAQMYAVHGDRKRCAAMLEEALAVYHRTLGPKDLKTVTVQ